VPGVIDSQSVKTTESSGPCGYAAEKMIKGRKRHVLTDTIGLPVGMIVTPANVRDRDAAPDLLASLGEAGQGSVGEADGIPDEGARSPGCTASLPMAAMPDPSCRTP
jgi:Transposase DDE domain